MHFQHIEITLPSLSMLVPSPPFEGEFVYALWEVAMESAITHLMRHLFRGNHCLQVRVEWTERFNDFKLETHLLEYTALVWRNGVEI